MSGQPETSLDSLDSMFSPRTGLFGSSSSGYGQCCPPVFDPYTLLALIGGIALATYFLRLVIVTTTFGGRSLGLMVNPFSGLLDDPQWIYNVLEDIVKINEELNAPDDDLSEISKRSVDSQEHNLNTTSLMPPQCRAEVWQCMSGVLERGIRWVDRPETFYSSLQPVLYKAVFHGGVKTMWSSVMEVPQMRKMGACISDHDRCVEHSILLSQVSSNFI